MIDKKFCSEYTPGMSEKIKTLHPDPNKQGVGIDSEKYDLIRQAIVEILSVSQPMTFTELTRAVETRLSGNFSGSIPWYTITVKLDLEARGKIIRIPGTKPEKIRLS
jgi:hypothetical protein